MGQTPHRMTLPLAGVSVLEFTHAVMGPACGVILADLGADVLRIEPVDGDPTRRLRGFGMGYFPYFNRNKGSLALDLKAPEGKEIVLGLAKTVDVVIENFGPGTIERLGYGWDVLSALNPRLVYCALKGFLSGPYEKRHAMDEVVQMMGGLAYMTGPPGQPLRAGTSVIDITGGMFGVIAILLALRERATTGKGSKVKSALFETTAFLMGQHMAYAALTDEPVPPMAARVSAWSVYRVFTGKDGQPVFVGLISDKHWKRFCEAFGREDLLANPRLLTNNDRIRERAWLLPEIERLVGAFTRDEIIARCEKADVPFAPIARPEDLFTDPQLNQGAGLLPTTFPGGVETKMPRLPIEVGRHDFGIRRDPAAIGADTRDVLRGAGYSDLEIDALLAKGVVFAPGCG